MISPQISHHLKRTVPGGDEGSGGEGVQRRTVVEREEEEGGRGGQRWSRQQAGSLTPSPNVFSGHSSSRPFFSPFLLCFRNEVAVTRFVGCCTMMHWWEGAVAALAAAADPWCRFDSFVFRCCAARPAPSPPRSLARILPSLSPSSKRGYPARPLPRRLSWIPLLAPQPQLVTRIVCTSLSLSLSLFL